MSLKITAMPTDKNKIKVNALMEDCTIPKFPQSLLMVGSTSSGKTTALMNLMTRKDFYKGYHDFIFLFSITAKLDDSFKPLKLKKDHMFDTEESMIENLQIIFEAQKRNVENKKINECPKILLIFEDLTTNEKLMRNTTFKSLWTLGRHLNMQVISMIHKYKALPRTQRMNAMNIMFFKATGDENLQLGDDYTPPGHTKKEFLKVIEYATASDKKGRHNFLYICNKLPSEIKFRKNFETILQLEN
jgi:hypothetical protein